MREEDIYEIILQNYNLLYIYIYIYIQKYTINYKYLKKTLLP